jgi:GNAT superfamily N-acetyltransferase
MLLDRLKQVCAATLPDATLIVHGSRALGDYRPDKSDVDLLVLSDAPTDGLVESLQDAWSDEPGDFDLRVVRYSVAAAPTRTPRLTLGIGMHGGELEIERDASEPDLLIEFSVCRQLGWTELIGPVEDAWVDEVGAAALARWKGIGYDPPHQELMAMTACRIWRFREERVHCSKPEAARWARARGARVAYDEQAVKVLLDLASG